MYLIIENILCSDMSNNLIETRAIFVRIQIGFATWSRTLKK